MIQAAFLLLLSAIAVEPIKISSGQMDWAALPKLQIKSGRVDGNPARQEIQKIIKKKLCDLPGATIYNFGGIVVRYAVLVDPDGQVEHIVVEPVGCRPLENVAGAMAKQIIDRKMIMAPGGDQSKWFGASMKFTN